MKYHAFISYSHAADGKLAPSIQQALERIAKPWYKLRNLNIFRDESTLSASPHLWDNIQKGLENAEYFILLASPLSAQSNWVEKEIQFWLDHKSLEKLIIVLTAGESGWDNSSNTFKHTETTALPKLLTDQFNEEPFFIDLRKTNTKQDISLTNPIFKKEVLKIAAQLHGVSPKNLASSEVRAHRRMMQLRNAVVFVLVSLLGFSIYKTLEANNNASLANEERNRAENQRDIALSNNLISEAQFEKTPSLALVYANEALNLNPTERIRKITNEIYASHQIGNRIVFNQHIIRMDSITFLPGDTKILTYGDIDNVNESYGYDFKRPYYTNDRDTIYALGIEYQLWDLQGNLLSVFDRQQMEDSFGDPFKNFREFSDLKNQHKKEDLPFYTMDIEIDLPLDYVKKAYKYKKENMIVCTGTDGAIRIWDEESGIQSKYQLDFDTSRNSEDDAIFSFSSDGKLMAVFYQRKMEIWDLYQKGLLRSTLSPDDIICSSINEDSSIQLYAKDTSYVWNWMSKDTIYGSSKKPAICLLEADNTPSNLTIDGDFSSLLVLRDSVGTIFRTLVDQKNKIWYHTKSPNKKFILTGTENYYGVYEDEIENEEKKDQLLNPIFQLNIETMGYKPIQAIFSKDNSKLLTKGIVEDAVSKYYLYHLWNMSTGELLKTFPIDRIKNVTSSETPTLNMSISDDGTLVFINYRKSLTVWQSPPSLCDFISKNLFLTIEEIEESKIDLVLWVDTIN